MTDQSRRSFLKGLLTVAAVSVAAPAALLNNDIPRIVGDGLHDDTLGLQAALDGKPFICEGQMVFGGDRVEITGGRFRISKTLTIARPHTIIRDSHFDGRGINDGPVLYWPASSDPSLIVNNYIQWSASA